MQMKLVKSKDCKHSMVFTEQNSGTRPAHTVYVQKAIMTPENGFPLSQATVTISIEVKGEV